MGPWKRSPMKGQVIEPGTVLYTQASGLRANKPGALNKATSSERATTLTLAVLPGPPFPAGRHLTYSKIPDTGRRRVGWGELVTAPTSS
jgi:hypothetical protein